MAISTQAVLRVCFSPGPVQFSLIPNSTAETPEFVALNKDMPSVTENGSPEQSQELNETQASSTSEPFSGDTPTPTEVSEGSSQPETSGEVEMTPEQIQQELVALAQANQGLSTQLEEINSQYQRLGADFENFRKRTQKEKEELELQIKCNTIKKLLPVIDNFERARSHLKPQTDSEMNIHKSYQGVYKQMVDCLKQVGVSPMRPEGETFDPNLHEAVMREPTDAHPEGTVIEELMRGYMLGDRVLRHAMVKVATAPEGGSTSEGETEGEVTSQS